MTSFLCRWFRIGCPKPAPVYVPVPVASCTHGVVIHRAAGVELDWLKALGVKTVRHTFYTTQDVGDYRAIFEARLLALDGLGIETLIVVHDFTDAALVAPTMASLTTTFPNRTWQVGNEYDAQPWRGWGNTGASYAAIMRGVVVACPGQRFVGMGLATADGQHLPKVVPDLTRQPKFLMDYLAAGGPTLAAWCLHTYGAPCYAAFVARVQATQQVLRGTMPLWVTEYNESGPVVMDAAESIAVADVTANAARLGVSRTYQYCYWDDANTGQGLVRKDESHRPAWETLHGVAA